MNSKIILELKESICWATTRQGAFQRANIYSVTASDSCKKAVRASIHEFLIKNIFYIYTENEIPINSPMKDINQLICYVEKDHKNRLLNEVFQWGNAQKFINLYLKCMWILGTTKGKPNHFPVDRIIIRNLRLDPSKYKWTDMNKEKYEEVIKAAQVAAGREKSLAEWEAELYFNEIAKRA